MTRRQPLAASLAAYSGVWVFVEQTEGEPAKVSWELLGKGRELADTLAVPLSAVVIGDGVENLCAESFAYGADQVYLIDAPVSATTGPKAISRRSATW